MFLKFLILRTIFGVHLDNVGNILEICVWPILALSRLQQFTKHFKATLLGWRTPLHLFSSGIVRQNTTFWWQQKEEFEPPSLSLYPVDSSRRQTIGNRVTAEKHKTCQESWPKICQNTTRTKGSRKLSKTAKETLAWIIDCCYHNELHEGRRTLVAATGGDTESIKPASIQPPPGEMKNVCHIFQFVATHSLFGQEKLVDPQIVHGENQAL